MWKNNERFARLRLKMYSYMKYNDRETKRLTGTKILKRQIKFEDYKNCLNARVTDKKSNWSNGKNIEQIFERK